jgi:hypothetical protein
MVRPRGERPAAAVSMILRFARYVTNSLQTARDGGRCYHCRHLLFAARGATQ